MTRLIQGLLAASLLLALQESCFSQGFQRWMIRDSSSIKPTLNRDIALYDSAHDHELVIAVAENLTADRTLNLDLDDADRTLTIAGDATISGTSTGDVTLAGTPNYITISGQVITRNKLDLVDDLNTFSSANLATNVTDETGSGVLVFGTAPTFTTSITSTLVITDTIDTTGATDIDIGSADVTDVTITTDGTGTVVLDGTGSTINGNAIADASDHLGFFSATTSAQLAGVISDETGTGAAVFGTSPTITTDITIPNTGLHVLDTNASHDLIFKPGADLTADRTLTVTTPDSDVTLDIEATSTLNQDLTSDAGVTFATVDTGQGANELYAMDQDVQTSDSPTFVGLTLTGDLAVNGDDITSDGDLTITPTGDDVFIAAATATDPQKLHVFDGGADNEPGSLVLYEDDGTAHYLFFRSDGTFAEHSAFPTDDDTDGNDIGGGGGSSEWTDTGTVLHPNETGDDVALGNTTLVNASKLSIDGDADQVQFTIQGNSTQTDSLLILENSAGTEVGNWDVDGTILTAVGVDAIGAVDIDIGSADVTDVTITTDGTGTVVLDGTGSTINGNAIADASDHLGFFSATTSAQLAGVISDETGTGAAVFGTSPTITTDITIPNTGLHLLDTNASHDLIVKPGSDVTADRTLTFTTGDADRTVTIDGNPTLNDWFDQGVKTTSAPTFATVDTGQGANELYAMDQDVQTGDTVQFAGIELGHATDTTLARVSAGVVSIEGDNVIDAGSTDVIVKAMFADEDWGDVSVSANSVTLDTNVVDTAEIAADAVAFADIDHSETLAANPAFGASESYFGSTGILFEGTTADTNEALIDVTDPTADRTFTFPDASGEVSLLGQDIASAEIADGDHGDFTYSSGTATLDANVVDGAEIVDGGVDATEIDETDSYDWTGIHTFDSDAVQIDDTNASHQLVLTPGSDLTADRVLTLTTGDAARTVTLNGNPTLDDWFDQAVKTTSAPTFATVDTGQGANELYAMDQNVQTSDSPTFVGLTLTGDLAVNGDDITSDGDLTITPTGDDVFIASAAATDPQKLHLFDGGADNEPGSLVLYEDDGTAHHLFFRSDGTFAEHSAFPTDDDTDGNDIGGSGGSGAFDDSGDPIVQNTTTKDVHVGDGAGTLAGKLEIGGDADQPQLVIEGHSTQTDDLLIIQQDDDTELFSVSTSPSLFMREVADAPADKAAYGQVWVNTATPNELYFTDDAGTDGLVILDSQTGTVTGTMILDGTVDVSDDTNLSGTANEVELSGDSLVLSDTVDIGAHTSLEIPNGATPTAPNVAGEVVLDTNLFSANQGTIVAHDGTQVINIVSTTDTPADNEIPKYDSGTGTITWEADAGGGSGAFDDSGDPIVQNTTTKDVHIGDGAGTLTGKLEIGGDADQPQLVVEGHSTQTDSLAIFQNDADTQVANIDVDGTILTAVGLDAIGAVDMDYGSADVTDHTFTTDGTGTAEVVLPAGSIDSTEILDNTLGLADWESGTDGELITFDANGDPAYVATGTSGQVLTSNGAGAAPTFQAIGKPDKVLQWSGAGMMATKPDAAGYDGIAPTNEDDTGDIRHWLASYDDTDDEARMVVFRVPDDIDTSGTVTFGVVGYSLAGSTTNEVVMFVAHGVYADSENVDPTLTTETSAAETIDGTADDATAFEWTETVSSLGWAVGDLVVCYLCRDGDNAGDDLSGDFDVELFYIEIPRS